MMNTKLFVESLTQFGRKIAARTRITWPIGLLAESAFESARSLIPDVRDAMIASKRAFVFVKNIEPRFIGKKTTHTITGWNFITLWENGGNTPAKNRTTRVHCGVFEQPIEFNFEFPDLGDVVSDGGVIGPKAVMPTHTEIPVEIFDKARSESAHVYMWGWTDYNDIFQRTKRHRTEFCVEIVVHGDVRTETCQFSFAQQGRHNGSDEQCLREPGSYFRGECYKFLKTGDVDKVIVDGTIKISSGTHFRELEAVGGWGAIADPLEAASLLTIKDRLDLTENSAELEMVNKANIGLGSFQQFAQISGGGRMVIHPGVTLIHTTPEVYIYSAAAGELNHLTTAMCVEAEKPYDACLKIVDLAELRARIFEAGRVLGLNRKVSDIFEPGVIQPVRYESRSRDIREGPVIEPSPFKKALRYKPQSEVRLLLIPKDEAQIPKEPLIIKVPDPASLFQEVFRDFRPDTARHSEGDIAGQKG
jgi:hypothetical protein